MTTGKAIINGDTFEAQVEFRDNRWWATVLEPNTRNEPVRFGPEEAASEEDGKKACEEFLSELLQQKLWR